MAAQSKPIIEQFVRDDTVFIHFTKPLANPNRFQKVIQKVQHLMGWSKWETTHVFASCNKTIFDRVGVKTVTGTPGDYFKQHYKGQQIDSFGITDPNMVSDFNKLTELVSKKDIHNVFTEEPFSGEYYLAETVKYAPNNSVYGIGNESVKTIKDTLALALKGTIISEDKAIKEAEEALKLKSDAFIPSSKLKNPTYCSLTIQELIPALEGQRILRYPALSHSLFQDYIKYNMIRITTTIDE